MTSTPLPIDSTPFRQELAEITSAATRQGILTGLRLALDIANDVNRRAQRAESLVEARALRVAISEITEAVNKLDA